VTNFIYITGMHLGGISKQKIMQVGTSSWWLQGCNISEKEELNQFQFKSTKQVKRI